MMLNKKQCLFFLVVCVTAGLLSHMKTNEIQAAEKKVAAAISSETVTVGKQIHIETKTKNVTYATSDPTIATVSEDGRVTGKKAGAVVIAVKKGGYQPKKFAVTVKAYGKYPSIPVTLDETGIELECGSDQISAVITNHAKRGSIQKIEYVYDADGHALGSEENEDSAENLVNSETDNGEVIIVDEGQEEAAESQRVTICAEEIDAGQKKTVNVTGDFGDPEFLELRLISVCIYTGKVVLNYDMTKNRMTVKWRVKDTTPPVISGWIGKNGYNSKDVYMVAYSDRKYDFKKYVHASDNMGGKVSLSVDTSGINWKKSGVYKLTYTAKDLAGNVARKSAKVQVRAVSDLDRMADSILKHIVKDSWSDQKKAEAIYRYVRKNYIYVDSNDHASWEKSALYGLRYQSGNCFVFYSVSRLLLTRCGIPNIEVKRSAGSSHGHWWNYVYIDGGWYHFDTTPRRRRATFCLLTDDQLTAYSKAAGNSHIWDKTLIPKGATKKISTVKWGKSY